MASRKNKGNVIGCTCRTVWIALLAAVASAAAANAATPPDRLNYQGVLRDIADAPLDGDFDMVFRFWSAESAGDEILIDRHVAVNLQAVTVTGGDPGDAAPGDSLDATSHAEMRVSAPTVRFAEPSVPVAPPSPDAPASDARLPSGAVLLPVSGAVEVGDLLTLDPDHPSNLRVATTMAEPRVVGLAVLPPSPGADGTSEVAVLGFGFATIKVDAGYGAIVEGDLLTSSATPGHAMLALTAEPGTIVGKALEPLDVGTGTIRVLLMAR